MWQMFAPTERSPATRNLSYLFKLVDNPFNGVPAGYL